MLDPSFITLFVGTRANPSIHWVGVGYILDRKSLYHRVTHSQGSHLYIQLELDLTMNLFCVIWNMGLNHKNSRPRCSNTQQPTTLPLYDLCLIQIFYFNIIHRVFLYHIYWFTTWFFFSSVDTEQELDPAYIAGFACLGVGLSLILLGALVCIFYYQRNRIGHYNFAAKPKQENFTYLVFNA